MKTLTLTLGVVLLLIAGLATPIGIGYGIYSWVITGLEFKFALWAGFKVWLLMLCGLIGYPLFLIAK